MGEQFDVYQTKTRWMRGGEVVREWSVASFEPMGAVDGVPIRDGMTVELDACREPTHRISAPPGSKLVEAMGDKYLRFGDSRQCISAGIALEYATAGRFTLSAEALK